MSFPWDAGKTFTVYAYKAGTTIVYIGCTSETLAGRDKNHRGRSAWWLPIYTIEALATYSARRDAFRAEAAAIELHRPMFNVLSNPDYPQGNAKKITAVAA